MFKRFLKWLGFRKRRVPHGELCPWSGDDYKFVCNHAAGGECNASLRQLLTCPLNDGGDRAAIRRALEEMEGAVHGERK